MSSIRKAFEKSESFNQFLEKYSEIFQESFDQLQSIDFAPVVATILECHEKGKKILVMGNGGSAANASHIATGLSFITRKWDKPLRSMSLSGDAILMTSLSNDFSYEDLFYRQLQIHLEEGDLVMALSVSGNSKNVIRGIEYAKSRGNKTIAFLGSDGGQLLPLIDLPIHIKNDECLFGLTEDVHMILGHALSYYLEYYFASKKL